MFKKVVVIRGIAAILLAGPMLAGGVSAEQSWRVGVLGQRVGSNSALGRAYEEAIALGLQTINEEQGGVLGKRLEVVLEDSGGSPESAAAALKKLITVEGVVMTVGETQSQNALMEAEIAERFHHPLIIAEALADDVTARNGRYVFRASPCNSGIINDTLMGFVSENGFQRIVMIVEDTNFGQNAASLIEKGLKELGLGVLAVPTSRGTADLAGIVRALKEFAPDFIVVLHQGLDLTALDNQIRAAGLATPLPLCVYGPSLAGLWTEGAANGPGGHLMLRGARLHPAVDVTEESRKLRRIYRDQYQKELSDYRVRSIYDALMIAADALRRAGSSDCEKLVVALEQTHLAAAGGVVRFSGDLGSYRYHHWQPPVLILQKQDQQTAVVYPRSLATSALQR
jgi:branched-chain amino acid transport system substrate-binding protein